MLRPSLFWASILVSANFLYADPSVLPGVVLEIRGKASNSIDYRLERRVALRVDKNEPSSAFVDAGPFEAFWSGVISVSYTHLTLPTILRV